MANPITWISFPSFKMFLIKKSLVGCEGLLLSSIYDLTKMAWQNHGMRAALLEKDVVQSCILS